MIKEKRFLITTALEESWVNDQPVLFLGEWCRIYSRKDIWSEVDAILLPYHWAQSEKLHSDYRYLNELYERTLFDLASSLNKIHKVEYSVKYWRVLVGPWIANLVHVLYDRWLSIQSALEEFEITGTIVLEVKKDILVANDTAHFLKLIETDLWNHNIYSEIIKKLNDCKVVTKKSTKRPHLNSLINVNPSIKSKILNIYSEISKFFSKDEDILFFETYLHKFDDILLQLKFGQLPQFWKKIDPIQIDLDEDQRNWEMPNCAESDFENFLLQVIPKQIPKVFLEGYQQLIKQANSLPWPKSPKLMYSANMLWHNSVTLVYVAEKVETGTPFVYGQHGGGYGVASFSFAEEHEVRVADKYLTWGWSDEFDPSTVPIGIGKVPKPNKLQVFNNYERLFLITLNASRYSFRLGSETTRNFPDYFEDYFLFTSSINNKARNNMLVRLSSWDQGWEQSLRWADNFPNTKLELGKNKINDLMLKSRLVVHTYNSTGILESLAMEIPSILFYDLKNMPLRESAAPYFEELKRVGIFHDSPESAAAHVDAIWEDVDSWWRSPEVKMAVANFNEQYCFIADNISNSVEAVLRETL